MTQPAPASTPASAPAGTPAGTPDPAAGAGGAPAGTPAPGAKPVEAAPAAKPAEGSGTPSPKPGEQAGTPKPGESKPQEKPDDAAPSKPTGTELKLPEGGLLREDDLTRVKELAAKNNLAPEQAQALLDAEALGAKNFSDRQMVKIKETIEAWRAEAAKDPEIAGKDGKELAGNLEEIRRVFQKVGGDEFLKALDETGIGNNLKLLRFGMRLKRMTEEDRHVPGTTPGSGERKSTAEVLYGKTQGK